MLILLRVTASESMIPRPCFQPLLHRLLSFLLHVTSLPFLLQIYYTLFFRPYYPYIIFSSLNQCIYTITHCIMCVEDTRESSHHHSIHYFLAPFVTNTFCQVLLRCGGIDNSAAKSYRYSLAPLVSNQ